MTLPDSTTAEGTAVRSYTGTMKVVLPDGSTRFVDPTTRTVLDTTAPTSGMPTPTEGAEQVTGTPATSPATPTEPAGFGARNTVFTAERAQAAKQTLLQAAGRLNANPFADPEMVQAAIEMGGYYVEGGLRDVGAWTRQMIADFGEEVRPHLDTIWRQVNQTLAGQARSIAPDLPDSTARLASAPGSPATEWLQVRGYGAPEGRQIGQVVARHENEVTLFFPETQQYGTYNANALQPASPSGAPPETPRAEAPATAAPPALQPLASEEAKAIAEKLGPPQAQDDAAALRYARDLGVDLEVRIPPEFELHDEGRLRILNRADGILRNAARLGDPMITKIVIINPLKVFAQDPASLTEQTLNAEGILDLDTYTRGKKRDPECPAWINTEKGILYINPNSLIWSADANIVKLMLDTSHDAKEISSN
ncbi:MAG TPA: hypothetical protein VGM23_07010, partial [Armatimonadota bacterium]